MVCSVDLDASPSLHLHGQCLSCDMPFEIGPEIFQPARRAGPSPPAQVRKRCGRGRAGRHALRESSRSPLRIPSPSSMPASKRSTQGRPSRQGVHQPQDSCAKKCSRLRTMPTGQVLSSSTIIAPVPSRLPIFSTSKFIGMSRSVCHDEAGGGAAGQYAAQFVTFLHAAGMVLDDLAQRRAHRQFPGAGPASPGRWRRKSSCRRPRRGRGR